MELAGRGAVVTGATGLLGRVIATALADHGAMVALVARDEARLAAVARDLPGARPFAADVASPAAVEALAERVRRAIGDPTILVNAAGAFGPLAPLADGDPHEWIRTLHVDVAGPYLTCRAFVPGMLTAGWGRILNVSSAASLHPPGALNSAYGTAKAALNQLTRHLAAELAGTGVTANVFHPGDVRTAMWADIRERAQALGNAGAGFRAWVDWVDETGGDPPQKAADLVLEQVLGDASVNGRFLWIRDPLQPPVRAWEDGEL